MGKHGKKITWGWGMVAVVTPKEVTWGVINIGW
jgi:hypothetical protein